MRAKRPRDAWARKSRVSLLTRVRIAGASLGGGVAAVVLLGYACGIERAWRLSHAVASTHPLTAACILLLGIGLLPYRPSQRKWRLLSRAAVLVALVILVPRVFLPYRGAWFINAITPFRHTLAAQTAAGTPVLMGANAARALLAITASEILRWFRRPTASQILACCAIGLFFVALNGYLDGLPRFQGALAPQTLLGGVFLAIAALSATARDGFMRALLARSEPGRLARLLLGCSTPLVLLLGWTMSRTIGNPALTFKTAAEILAYQTAAIIILTWVLVTVATVRADHIDRSRRAAEGSLHRAATTDKLTGLLSRNRMETLLTAANHHLPPPPVAKLIVDLDRFRAVNEAFGHAIGDQLLVEVGRRLSSISGRHHLGRIGGDEFALYGTDVTPDEAEQIGFAATAILAMPFHVRGRSFHLTASVGIAHTSTAGATDLRQAADSAMYVAKRRGGNQAVAFVCSMHEDRRGEIELEQDLYEAMDRDGELSLVYQPVIRVSDHALLAVEALARWDHPQLGPITPDRFIQLAETTGLIVPLGMKLMTAAVRQAALWRDLYPSGAPIININISPVQFAGGDVISDLLHLLWQQDLPPSAICLEVTEGAFTDEHAIRALREARQAGFTVAMDDFGVGYSSLSQLPRLPLVSVKLDRSFILDAASSAGDATLLAAIVQLAHGLKLTVVAEGVEHPEQLDLVTRAGCDGVQGYIFSRPMKAIDFEVWVAGGIKQTGAVP